MDVHIDRTSETGVRLMKLLSCYSNSFANHVAFVCDN